MPRLSGYLCEITIDLPPLKKVSQHFTYFQISIMQKMKRKKNKTKNTFVSIKYSLGNTVERYNNLLTQTVGKNHPFSKIAVTFERIQQC